MEKIIKNNWWNRIFHKGTVKAQTDKYIKCKAMLAVASEIIQDINSCKTLNSLLEIHKFAWKWGFRNENIGPCPYGMFRTKDILNMTIDEVYLGNIYGLNTMSIRFWNEMSYEDMGGNGFGIPEDTKCYDLVLDQYKGILRSNIYSLKRQANEFVMDYIKVNKPKDPFKLE